MAFWTTPIGWTLITVGEVLLVLLPVLIGLALLIYADRKIWAGVQMRKGPNMVGPWGILQSFADMGKFLIKELIIPAGADKVVFLLAPILSTTLALGAWAAACSSSSFLCCSARSIWTSGGGSATSSTKDRWGSPVSLRAR